MTMKIPDPFVFSFCMMTPRRWRRPGGAWLDNNMMNRVHRVLFSLLLSLPSFAQAASGEAVHRDAVSAAPTRVTISLDAVPAEKALAMLGEIGGVDFRSGHREGWRETTPVTLKVKDAGYWPTVMAVCRQAKIGFDARAMSNFERKGQFILLPGGPLLLSQGPRCEVGGSLLVVQSLRRTNSLEFPNPERVHDELRIGALLMLDSSVHVAGTNLRPELTMALDENGLSLLRPAGGCTDSLAEISTPS